MTDNPLKGKCVRLFPKLYILKMNPLTIFVAPPSLPVCQWDGDIDMGGSVTLSCSVVEGAPTPEIRWDKLNPEEITLPINMEGQ